MTQNRYRQNMLLLCVLWAMEDTFCSQEEPDHYLNPIMSIIVLGIPVQFNQLLKTCPEAVHTRDHTDENTPLHVILVWSGTLSSSEMLRRVERLIKAGADVNTHNNRGDTPLHFAADRGLLHIVKLLVRHGAAVNTQNKYGHAPNNTPLHLAVQKRHEEVAQFLLAEKDILVDAKNTAQGTPLHYAIEKGLLDTIRLLVKHGASLDARTQDGRTPLHYAALSGRGGDIVSFLIAQGADISSTDTTEQTPLHAAAFADTFMPAQLLLAAGSDIDAPDSYKKTPLHLAVQSNNRELVQFLVSNGADVDVTDDRKNAPLKIAIARQHNQEIAHLLIARGAATDFLTARDIIGSHMGRQGTFLLNLKKIQEKAKAQRLAALGEIRIFPLDVDKLILAYAFNDTIR